MHIHTPNTMLTLPIPSSKVSSQCEFFYFCLDAWITHLFPMSGSTLSTIPTMGLIPQSTVSNLPLQRRPSSGEARISRTEAEALLSFLSNPFALHVCPTNDHKFVRRDCPIDACLNLRNKKAHFTMPSASSILYPEWFLFSVFSLSSFRSVAVQSINPSHDRDCNFYPILLDRRRCMRLIAWVCVCACAPADHHKRGTIVRRVNKLSASCLT